MNRFNSVKSGNYNIIRHFVPVFLKHTNYTYCHDVICTNYCPWNPFFIDKLLRSFNRRHCPEITIAYHTLIEPDSICLYYILKYFYSLFRKTISSKASNKMNSFWRMLLHNMSDKHLKTSSVIKSDIYTALIISIYNDYLNIFLLCF